jgi:hypothetical protein
MQHLAADERCHRRASASAEGDRAAAVVASRRVAKPMTTTHEVRMYVVATRVPRSILAAALAGCAAGAPALAAAQQPAPASDAYRLPSIVMVQPVDGGSVPRDKPIVVFRLASGEPTDPIDTRSFAVTVDGADRTAAFQVTATEAWGLVAEPDVRPADMGSGATHTIAARICSQRGACAALTATVATVMSPAMSEARTTRKARLIDLLLTAMKKLLEP